MTFLLIETALFLQLDHDYDVVDADDDDSPVTCKRQVASDLLANTIRSPSGERGAQTRIDKDGRNESQNHNFKKVKKRNEKFQEMKKKLTVAMITSTYYFEIET